MTYKEFQKGSYPPPARKVITPLFAAYAEEVITLMNAIPRRKREWAWRQLVKLFLYKKYAPPLEIGSTVWVCLDKDICDDPENLIDENTVTGIGIRGFWVSAYAPAQDDTELFITWDRLEKDVFLSRRAAEVVSKEVTSSE